MEKWYTLFLKIGKTNRIAEEKHGGYRMSDGGRKTSRMAEVGRKTCRIADIGFRKEKNGNRVKGKG